MTTSEFRISYVSKSDHQNPTERIWYVGGVTYLGSQWKLSQAAAIDGIERGQWQFWVSVLGKRVWVEVAMSRFGKKYLKTQIDDEEPNILLSLPGIPQMALP